MKKFLLTLIVTMLTCLGAWAQDVTVSFTEHSLTLDLANDASGKMVYYTHTNGDGKNWVLSFDTGESGVWGNGPTNSVCHADFSDGGIKIEPKGKGTTILTFAIKDYSNNVLASDQLTITVADLSLANEITYSPNQDPVKILVGGTTEVYISTTPAEAIKSFQDNYTQSVGNISVQSFDKNTGKVVFFASSDATTGETGTFVFNAKFGSTAESISIPVTVADPVAATGITLKVGGEAVTSATTYTLEKNQTLNVLAEVTPEDATNRGFYWSSYDSNVINLYNGTVTAVGHGSTTLQATSNEGGFTTPVLTFNVTEPITNATTTIEVPTTTRVGVTGAKAVVKVNDAVAGSDFGITYESSDQSVVKVNAAGELEFVGAGNATITATLNPAASTFYTGTKQVTSANISVGDEIKATSWAGSIETTSLEFGEQKVQSADWPTVTWSETVAGATTLYTVVSDDESIVSGKVDKYGNDLSLILEGLGGGTTNVTIKAEYGTSEYDNTLGKQVIKNPLAVATFGPQTITVAPLDVTLSVDALENNIIDVSETGETKFKVTATPVSGFGTTITYTLTGDDVVTHSWNANDNQIILKPKTVLGTTTITVKAVWNKYGGTATKELTESFNVTVDDKTLVKALVTPADQEVQQGKDNEISVLFVPFTTAEFQAPTVDDENNTGITVAYANGGTDYTKLVVTVPDNATLGSTAKITLNPKEGSSVDPVQFTVTVCKPELPVTDVKPQDVIHVGELYTAGLSIPDSYELEEGEGKDYTVTYVATGTNKDDQPLVTINNYGEIQGKHVGVAHIKVTFAPNPESTKASVYKAWEREMDLTVIPGETALDVSVTKSEFEQGEGGSTTLNYNIGTPYSGIPCTDYTLQFDVEGTAEGVTLGTADEELKRWTVIVGENAPVEQFALVVNLVPNNKEDYNTATAKVGILVKNSDAKVTISVDENGVYTVNVPSPGAFGGISYTPDVILENGATVLGLANAEKVKVTGLLSISDVKELNHLVGTGQNAPADMKTGECKSLDMGDAQLTEKVETHKFGDYLGINLMDDGDFWSHRLLTVENMVLPKPSPEYTVLPEAMYGWFGGNTSSLKSLTIPEGWTVAAKNSFSPDAANGALVAANSLTLPSTLTYIGENAFAGVKAPVIMIPPLVTYIGDGAFSSSDPCDVADVYFTGHAPKYVGQRAFSTAQQMGNNTTNNTVVADDGRTDRNFLVLSGKNVCLMHYPAEYEDEYIDKSRNYTATDRYGKGIKDYNTPYNPGWTSAQLHEINAARAIAFQDNNLLLAFDFSNAFDPGYRDLTVSDRIWPSQQLMTAAYTMAWLGYHWDGTPMTQAELDKRGLYQFITTMSDAPDHPSDWEFEGYEADKWYTINLPFDMSVEQIQKVFGYDTQVCRFSKVTRQEGVNPEENTLIFEFRNSVMSAAALDSDGQPSTGNLSTYHHVSTGLANKERDYRGQTGIVHGTPYMIKPKGTTDCPIVGEGHQIKRTFEGYVMIGEGNNIETITATDGSSVYSFAGTRRLTPLIAGTYFLGRKSVSSPHQYFFYLGGSKQRTPYTAAIFAADGGSADGSTFFGVNIDPTTPDLDEDGDDDEPSITHAAPVSLISLFGDDEGVNTIENFTIVCGDDKMPDNKVYTINGQLISGKNLPAGLYIKNGKKFIVK